MIRMPTNDPRLAAALAALKRLREAGFESYWVGGCVRDLLMNRAPRDYDIATAARPDDVRALFSEVIGTGAAFAVLRVREADTWIEISTFRRDIGSADGRHPEQIAFGSACEDAHRRDFTINGLFFDPIENRVLDYVEGQADIARRLIRAIGIADRRFEEDYLRMLRAVRFASTLEFDVEIQTLEAIRRLAPNIGKMSAERIQYELNVLLTESPRAGRGLRLLRDAGLLEQILPEVAAMVRVEQPAAYHPEGDVFEHTVVLLDLMPAGRSLELAYAALLHDVGKPPMKTTKTNAAGETRPFFPEHAERGAEMATHILQRLRLPNRVIETVAECVRNHMRFMNVREMRPSKLRSWMAEPSFGIQLELHRLDCLASNGDLTNYHFAREFLEKTKAERQLPQPWITGNDIMRLGVPEGPEVGRFRRMAYEAQLDGRFAARDQLLEWLEAEIRKSGFTPDQS